MAWSSSRFKDFRENLFSIFVDNLNPKVDQRGLWDVFKPFGKVRDVYLSMEKRARRSRFAFVRFESLEEAVKVAKTTDGMIVYGWSIVSKMATSGWSNRKVSPANQRTSSYDEKTQTSRGGGDFGQKANDNERTFVDVVRGLQDKSFNPAVKMKEGEKMLKMSWDIRQGEEEWLSRCAVGILKNFTEVSKVNQRLLDAGFAFSSSYLGDKSILWCLDSVSHKEAFIFNKFMWEDSFSAMVRWSESVIPQSRLAWINCWGAPLSCWSPDFFKSLGWKVGEPLLVEEEVENRNRLDRGRMLVLVPQSKLCSTTIIVNVGKKSYVVKLEEDCVPVDLRWTECFLGLSKLQNIAGLVMLPGVDSLHNIRSKAVGELSSPRNLQANCQTGNPTSKSKSGMQGNKKLFVGNVNRLRVSDKGKKKWVGKAKKKFSVGFMRNCKLNLDKRQNFVISSEESSSSTEVSMRNRIFKDSLKARGECSNNQAIRVHNEIELCVDLGSVEVISPKVLQQNWLKPILEVDEELSASSENGKSSVISSLKEAMVESTVAIDEEIAREGVLVQISEVAEKDAEDFTAEVVIVSAAAEGERVREDETVQIKVMSEPRINKPVAKKKGIFSNGPSSKHSLKTRHSEIIEEEVSKVMEVGTMLGLDFSGFEKEMSEVISRRELEDLAMMDDQEG